MFLNVETISVSVKVKRSRLENVFILLGVGRSKGSGRGIYLAVLEESKFARAG